MKRTAWSFFAAVMLCLTSGSVAAQQNALTNDSIVQMVKSGLGEDLVVGMIQSMPGAYMMTPGSVSTLKSQGLTDRMLAAMISKGSGGGGSTDGASAGNPNDPLSPHDPGIWLYSVRDGTPRMAMLKPATLKEIKSGSGVATAFTYGIAKQKMKDVIAGNAAAIRAEANPMFYLYFADGPRSVKTFGGAGDDENLKQISLVRTSPTRTTREITTNAINAFGTSSTTNGVLDKDQIAYRSERIRDGVYKLTAEKPLKAGEYCFRFTGRGMFDFGVD